MYFFKTFQNGNRKLVLAIALAMFIVVISFVACSKVNEHNSLNTSTSSSKQLNSKAGNDVSSYSEAEWVSTLNSDTSFANVLLSTIRDSRLTRCKLSKDSTLILYLENTVSPDTAKIQQHIVDSDIDSSQIVDLLQDMFAYQAMFYYNQTEFFNLNISSQENIIKETLAHYYDHFESQTSIGKIKLEIARSLVSTIPHNGPLPPDFSVTWGGAAKCAAITLVGIFADNLKNIKLVVDALRGEPITYGAVKAALSLLGQSMGGWYTVLKAVILFTACLLLENIIMPAYPNCS